ncbi:HAMP domain-containing sensor histidine kinase [Bacillus sp. FJAT-49736]|uniref:sensor histidine kinase n=1 Tax=Bacillus sp. FJAT-49736 TaxID=2833582 RepID=UPI001BC8FA02|nr:HAMP domain-containing sensor histidine kinase [Bacillus sp. FJAT-49736]MBS4174191.1 HAMP domain-containing histidine kinase [Bacillus sp. FJAT-49736]
MLRNKEIQMHLFTMCIISLAAVTAAVFFSIAAMLLIIIVSILLIGCSLLFTKRRYLDIERLSGYLRQIHSGDYSLDVRDNVEGELSILKNDIYKVTMMLSEQRALLQKDKIQLTNAISDISHQLKTPLTSMMMMSDLLRDRNLPAEKRREFTKSLRNQLERLEWLVSSLLKLSKIDAGTAHFKQEPVVVERLVQKALEHVLIPMEIKEQTVSIIGEHSVTFLGDFHWTVEALINILKNCVEHTSENGVITIFYSENVLFTEIRISDNGIGIEKADLLNIFKRFYKGKNAAKESVGIGLAMAHSIITSQNGDIEVKSKKGEGTSFQIKFYKQVI